MAELGAITYFDREEVNEDDIVNVNILTNNIYEICKTASELIEKFNIKSIVNTERDETNKRITDEFEKANENALISQNDEKLNGTYEEVKTIEMPKEWFEIQENGKLTPSFEYNDEILNYYGIVVSQKSSEFIKIMLAIIVSAMFIIGIVSTIMLYATFKMSYSDRIREFGMLTSMGMGKKQKNKVIRKEITTLGGFRNIISE